MPQFQGKRVSQQWLVVLTAAWDAGIRFTLTSGQRFMSEQQALVDEKGIWSYSNPHGAARPSKTAPHIRTGKQWHAIDVDSLDGGETRLQNWLRSEGVAATNTVPGESWHLELTEAGLRKLYNRYRKSHGFSNPARRWMREYDRLLRQRHGRARRSVLRREMKILRKQYFGSKRNLKLYTALLVRSR